MRFLVYTFLFLLPLIGFAQPPNDNCSAATVLSYTGTTLLIGEDNTSATAGVAPTDPVPSCYTNGQAHTVWYTYQTGNFAGTLSVTVNSTTGGAKGLGVAIYPGTCGTFVPSTLLGCAQHLSFSYGSATAIATCLTPNTVYYIYFNSKINGLFDISTTYSNTLSGPANNCCTSAQNIPPASLNGSTVIPGTTVGATNDAGFTACNTTYNNVWYSFVAQGPNLEVTVAASSGRPEFVVLAAAPPSNSNVCTATSTYSLLCSSTTGTATANNVAGTALVKDSTYYISVTNTLTTGATFTLNVNNPVPNPPGTDCATSKLLCTSTLPYIATGGNTNLWGYQDLTGSTGDCMGGTNSEIHSAWYYVSILTGGTLNINIASAATLNYDFSVWKSTTPNICDNLNAGTLVNCNSSPTATASTGFNASGVTTFTNSGSTINSQLTTTTGDTYAILVNSPKVAGTYTISITGTSVLSCTTPIILPVELTTFSATQNDHEVDLKWSTASETNNSYFTVERSADGINFEKLHKVKSLVDNGNSKSSLHYTDADYAPLAGVSYYRLSQTDNNGKTNKLNIVSISNKDNDGAFMIAPNPSDGTLNITYSCQAATIGTFKLYDSNGALFLEQSVLCALGSNKTQIDINDKPNGIYFATFTTNASFYRIKLMKR